MNTLNKYALAVAFSLSLCLQGICEENYQDRDIKLRHGDYPKEECVVVRVTEKNLSGDGKLQITLQYINYYTTEIFLSENPHSFDLYVGELHLGNVTTFDYAYPLRKLSAAVWDENGEIALPPGTSMSVKNEMSLPEPIREKIETEEFIISVSVHGYYRQDGSQFRETIKIKEKLIEPVN